RILKDKTAEDAMDDVVDRGIFAAVVDRVALEAYQRRKPGRIRLLKTLCSSEKFPDSVVAFLNGALPQASLDRCREGLLRAHHTKTGEFLLAFWGITHFESVPPDFDRSLTAIRAVYPPKLLSQQTNPGIAFSSGTESIESRK